jgi:phenylacetate-CoA ligase
VPGVGNNYIIEITKQNYMDKLTVKVEIDEKMFKGTLPELEQLQDRIADELRSELGVSPLVKLVEPESLPVTEGKARRVYDLRNAPKG